MLTVQLEALPEPKQKLIRKWLLQQERFELERAVKAELAELEARISEGVLAESHSVVQTKNIPSKAGDAMLAAMILRDFLDVLDEVSKEDRQFRSATATVT